MLELLSPAKLNLFFRVLRKRPDGYHDIASLYQAVDCFDRLFFSPAKTDLLTCSDPTLPCDSSNLVYKALQLFKTHFPFPESFHIHLEKKIPMQAGLGGGSSNAATTLWGLNELTGKRATLKELQELGALLGSDVAFFFSSGTAYCTGRGEVLTPYALPQPLSGWIAKPAYGLSTPLVYQHTKADYLPQRDPEQALKHFPTFYNDLEVPAFALEPRLAKLKEKLQRSGFESVTMTGSGTAFFCIGKKAPFPMDEVTFFPFHSIQRLRFSWYSP